MRSLPLWCLLVIALAPLHAVELWYAGGPTLPPSTDGQNDQPARCLVAGPGTLAHFREADPASTTELLVAGGWQAVVVSAADLPVLDALPHTNDLPPFVATDCQHPRVQPTAAITVGDQKLTLMAITGTSETITPSAALASHVPADDTGPIVLTADLDRAALADLLPEHPSIDCAIAENGVFDAAPLHTSTGTILAGPVGSGALTRTYMEMQGDAWQVHNHGRHIGRSELSADLARLYRATGVGSAALTVAIRAADLPPPDAVRATAPAPVLGRTLDAGHVFADGDRQRLMHSGHNDAALLTIASLRAEARYGGASAPAGSQAYLVLDSHWRNIMPIENLTIGAERVIYQAKNLADHCYLIADGSRLLRLHRDGSGLPGHLPTRPFALSGVGAEEQGNLVFATPKRRWHHLELRVYEEAYGDIRVPLVGDAPPEPTWISERPENAVIRLGLAAADTSAVHHGISAPAGQVFVRLDLRGQSLITVPLTDFIPEADPQRRVRSFADWTEWRQWCRLISSDERAWAPHSSLTIPETWRFPPAPATGKEIVFLVPRDAGSLQLRCRFPKAELPDGSIIEPQPLTLAVPITLDGPPPPDARGDDDDTADQNPTDGSDAAPANETTIAELLGHGRSEGGLRSVGLKAQDVNQAIDQGRAFLWRYLREEWGADQPLQPRRETHVLAALALVHADAHEKWPACDAAIRRFIEAEQEFGNVYKLSLFCMLLRAYDDASYRPILKRAATALLSSQNTNGSWHYGASTWPAADTATDEALVVHGGVPLDGSENDPVPLERTYPFPEKTRHNGDNSITQFAVLGLRSAVRAGFSVPPETWEKVRTIFRERQNDENGGWGYRGGHRPYGSMTCAGICSLAIARHELGIEPTVGGPAIHHGLQYLTDNFSAATNFNSKKWNFYYRYSYERVGRLLGGAFFGEHEWYPAGARVLVQAQNPDGSWIGTHSDEEEPEVATSFALLFLTRATEELEPQRIERGGDGALRTLARTPDRRAVHVILDASGSMLQEAGGSSRFERATAAVRGLIDALGSQAVVGLRAYGHRKRAIEEGASEDTELLVPVGPLELDTYRTALDALGPKGRTPMALSLRQALSDVRRHDGPVEVVLLTDGGEDPQSAYDPVEEATAYRQRDDIALTIVGLAIDRPDWQDQLRAMTTAAGGSYTDVAGAEDIGPRLREAVLHVPESYRLLDADGSLVHAGSFGDTVGDLPEGRYRLRTHFAGQTFEREVWINTNRTTSVIFDARAVAEADGGKNTPAASSEHVFCTICGTKLPADAKFCTQCGQQVE